MPRERNYIGFWYSSGTAHFSNQSSLVGCLQRTERARLPRPVRVGIEATGSMKWFLKLMEDLGIDCQVGHPATIRAAEPRRQKHDRRDAELLLKLLVEDRFPSIWQPSKQLLDLRALLLHRHQWVRLRTRIQNALQAIALANGLRRGSSLWSESGQEAIASLALETHTAHRRSELQAMYARFESEIEQLNQRVLEQANQRTIIFDGQSRLPEQQVLDLLGLVRRVVQAPVDAVSRERVRAHD
jgi:transposase